MQATEGTSNEPWKWGVDWSFGDAKKTFFGEKFETATGRAIQRQAEAQREFAFTDAVQRELFAQSNIRLVSYNYDFTRRIHMFYASPDPGSTAEYRIAIADIDMAMSTYGSDVDMSSPGQSSLNPKHVAREIIQNVYQWMNQETEVRREKSKANTLVGRPDKQDVERISKRKKEEDLFWQNVRKLFWYRYTKDPSLVRENKLSTA